MRKLFFKALTILIIFLLNGCASVYRPINPPTINYTSHDLKDGVSISYKYDVLNEKGNRKYARKENNKRLKLVSVKITNNTKTAINIGRDYVFYSGDKQVIPLEPIAIKNSIKQVVPGYLPYLLLTFVNLTVTKSTATGITTDVYPIGLGLGPGITIGNMAVAGTANSNLKRELYDYNILNRDIKKGETVYGIIGLKDVGYDPISIKSMNKNTTAITENDLFVSINDIYEEKEKQDFYNIHELKKNLYKIDTSISFENYFYRIIEFTAHPKIKTIEIVRERFINGEIKSIGLKAKHKLDDSNDDLYSVINYNKKIGTWRYYFENGLLKSLIDYNLNEEKDGRYIEYDITGNIKKEIIYKSGRKLK